MSETARIALQIAETMAASLQRLWVALATRDDGRIAEALSDALESTEARERLIDRMAQKWPRLATRLGR